MTGPTHVAIAAAATIGLASTGNGPDAAGWVAVVVGSLLPDIDAGGGTIARPGSLFGRLLPRWLAKGLDAIGLTISRIIRAIFGHRNAFHWPVWGLVLAMVGQSLGHTWLIWLGWGYVWHIMGDLLTVSGVPLFGPFVTKDIKFSPIRTGTAPEYLIQLACWGVVFWWGWGYLPPQAQYWLLKFGYSAKALIMG